MRGSEPFDAELLEVADAMNNLRGGLRVKGEFPEARKPAEGALSIARASAQDRACDCPGGNTRLAG